MIALMAVMVAAQGGAGGTGCAATKYPAELPAPGAIVDSAHAIEDLAMFADPAKPMIFSLVFDSGDSVARVRALDKSNAAAAVSLANYVRRQAPQELWAIRIRIAGGDTPALTLERSEYCPPVSRSGDTPFSMRAGQVTGVVTSGMAPPPPTSQPNVAVDIPVEALIGVDGRVRGARVVKTSGNPVLDVKAVTDMKGRKFEPAKLDGEPIEAVYRPAGDSPRP